MYNAQVIENFSFNLGVNMRQTIGYARVSTREQSENQHALEHQINRLKEQKINRIFFDIDSGANSGRENLLQVLNLVRKGEVEALVATRWDRLTRDQLLYINIKQLFTECGTRIIFLDQGEADLTTASGELNADLQVMFAVHERRMLRERVKRGFEQRRKKKVAWTRAPWGYRIENDKYVLDDRPLICLLEERPDNYLDLYEVPDRSPKLIAISRAQIAKDAIEIFNRVKRPTKALSCLYQKYGVQSKRVPCKNSKSNLTLAEQPEKQRLEQHKKLQGLSSVLTEELLIWSGGGHFKEWLQNPVLRGHTAYCKTRKKTKSKPPQDWEIHYDTHPDQRLMTDEDFQEIQDTLRSNSRKFAPFGGTFYLTGLIYCDRCGHKCVLKRSPQYKYYGCRHSSVTCTNRGCVRLHKIDRAIIDAIFQTALFLQQSKNPQLEFNNEPLELFQLKQDLLELEQHPSIETNLALKRAKYELVKQIESLSAQRQQLNFATATALEIIHHPQASKYPFWFTLTEAEREVVYEKLVRRVTILAKEVVSVELTV
ncbi:recombinase family protein [Kamptonema cortianum]|nr:recombinase family protein [Kamptonema cortianum]